MISAAEPGLSWFLWIAGVAFLLGSALPLLVAPQWWGRMFQWKLEGAPDPFTTYLGRCLGGVALALVIFAFRAAPAPEQYPVVVEILLVIAAIFALIHIVGALEGEQPWTENLEILMYLGILAIGSWLYLT